MGGAGEQADLPVICIGNFTAGGAGKTPTALAIAELLDGAGRKPRLPVARLWRTPARARSRYSRTIRADDVGDEPLLLAAQAPTIVSRNRPAGAQLA